MIHSTCFLVFVISPLLALAIETIPAKVDFSDTMQDWDGFGFNYVETCQTRSYEEWHQDYGGYSLLNDAQRSQIASLVFSKGGLNVEIIKMFLDPWHQDNPDGPFNHTKTTSNMLRFVEDGLSMAKKDGRTLKVITTLYGPPPWATIQKHIGGRDLDPDQFQNLAKYIIDWAKFLQSRDIPVKYLSIHNEGEDFYRWDHDDGTQRMMRFDYNAYWPPEQVNDFILVLSKELGEADLNDLGVTNGEPSNWTRFYNWGYAKALFDNKQVLSELDLLTTHGFINGDYDKLSYATANGSTTRLLGSERPDLHTWITSYGWGDMSTKFIKMAFEHIYYAGANALIPWACIQNPSQWIEGDQLGTAIVVNDDGEYKVTTGYYLYKQLTTAGFRGMKVARTMAANPTANIIAYSSNGSDHPDAFILSSNIRIWGLPYGIEITGTRYKKFQAYRTTEDGQDLYRDIGTFSLTDGKIIYDPPYGSVTTFIGVN